MSKSLFGKRYNPVSPTAMETGVGIFILILTLLTVVFFLTFGFSDGDTLFQTSESQAESSQEVLANARLIPPLGKAGWTSPSERNDHNLSHWSAAGDVASNELGKPSLFETMQGDLAAFGARRAIHSYYASVSNPTQRIAVTVVDAYAPEVAFGLYHHRHPGKSPAALTTLLSPSASEPDEGKPHGSMEEEMYGDYAVEDDREPEENAQNIKAASSKTASKPAVETAPLRVGMEGWQSSTGGAFWLGKHYIEFVRLNTDDSSPANAVIADALASVHLSYGRPFWIENLWPREGRSNDSLRYLPQSALPFQLNTGAFTLEYDDGTIAFATALDNASKTLSAMKGIESFIEQNGSIQSQPDGPSTVLAGDFHNRRYQLAAFAEGDRLIGVIGTDMGPVIEMARTVRNRLAPANGAAVSKSGSVVTDTPKRAFPSIDLPGWQPPDNLRVYTPLNLWEKIDGRADIYLSFGVADMAFGTYTKTDDPAIVVDVYWYDMATAEGAFGIFRAEFDDTGHTLALGDEAYEVGGSVFCRKGQHYLRVEAPDRTDVYLEATTRITKALANSIADSETKLWAEELLPSKHQIEGSFEFHAKDAFSLDFLSDVFAADYRFEGGQVKLFIHRVESSAQAMDVLRAYESFFEDFGRVVESAASESENNQGETITLVGESGGIYDAAFVAEEFLCGVTGASNATLAKRAAIFFKEDLLDKMAKRNAAD